MIRCLRGAWLFQGMRLTGINACWRKAEHEGPCRTRRIAPRGKGALRIALLSGSPSFVRAVVFGSLDIVTEPNPVVRCDSQWAVCDVPKLRSRGECGTRAGFAH